MDFSNEALKLAGAVVPTRRRVNLSSADILALDATPIILVPAQGANKVIRITNLIAIFRFVTTAYTIAPLTGMSIGTAIQIAAFAQQMIPLMNGLIDAAADSVSQSIGAYGPGAPLVGTANSDVLAQLSAAATLGDGLLELDLEYLVDDVS